jgi:hypothetical protein
MGSGREGTSNIERPTLNIEVKRREKEDADEASAPMAQSGSAGGGD